MATRRDFIKTATGAVAGAVVAGGCASDGGQQGSPLTQGQGLGPLPNGRRPNILLVLVDEMRLPPTGYAAGEGEVPDIKEIIGFAQRLSGNNAFAKFFPGLMRLRRNSVVLRNHYTASAACSPSRTTFLTGQYPSLHGVTQVTGTFKIAAEVRHLDPTGVPTVGDWFRAGGYETHYMGKWHVSDTTSASGSKDLEPFGFSNYASSWPEPDSSTDNLGTYRDPGFADIVSNFFERKKNDQNPWFAVASFVNPHDNGAYPCPFFSPPVDADLQFTGLTAPMAGRSTAQPIPPQFTLSNPNSVNNPGGGGVAVALNPDGFPQQCFALPPTYNEDLSTKPECHQDSAWKMQMALASAFPPKFQRDHLPYPIQALSSPLREQWAEAFGQFYVYLQYLVDLELDQILKSFDAAGLAENTIIVFTSDHGGLGMAHGMMLQKFFNSYEESLKVPFVVSGPLVNPNPDQMLEYHQPTSHIDLAPSLLGLAGFSDAQIADLKSRITGHTQVRDFVGLNLAPLLASGAPLPRPGVLFTTSDDATRLPEGVAQPDKAINFGFMIDQVNFHRGLGAPLAPGACVEPNTCHMLCTGTWKYSRYMDDNGVVPDQFEFYHLPSDPNETVNLVDFRSGLLRPTAQVPGLTRPQLEAQLAETKAQLAAQEASLLLTPV